VIALNQEENVVISGLGSITPAGLGVDPFVEACFDGESPVEELTKFDPSQFPATEVPSHKGGEVDLTPARKVIKDPSYLRTPPVTQFVLVSALKALEDANLEITEENEDRVGIFFLTCNGCINSSEEVYENLVNDGPGAVPALSFVDSVFNAPVSKLSIMAGIKGPVVAYPLGRGGLGATIEHATLLMESGMIDYALVGGADELNGQVYEAYSCLDVLSPSAGNGNSTEASRPYDEDRNGFVLSEGGAFILLERESNDIEKRGTEVYGRLSSCVQGADAYEVADVDPSGEGLETVLEQNFRDSDKSPEDVDFVVGSASGSRKQDAVEARALEEYLPSTPVTNITGLMGDTAAGKQMLNVILALHCMRNETLPPIRNLETPEFDLDFVVNSERDLETADTCLLPSFDWGGIYNSLILESR
jgi:3-oxoacyl-(acyl-carrier-protein) synthase